MCVCVPSNGLPTLCPVLLASWLHCSPDQDKAVAEDELMKKKNYFGVELHLKFCFVLCTRTRLIFVFDKLVKPIFAKMASSIWCVVQQVPVHFSPAASVRWSTAVTFVPTSPFMTASSRSTRPELRHRKHKHITDNKINWAALVFQFLNLEYTLWRIIAFGHLYSIIMNVHDSLSPHI